MWTQTTAQQALDRSGYVVDIGQVTKEARTYLDRLAKDGRLVKYRGFWNTLSPFFGCGPMKTIWMARGEDHHRSFAA